MSQIITIVLDDLHPATVYVGDIDPRVAAHACWKAAEALDEEVEGMVVDRTLPSDWSSS